MNIFNRFIKANQTAIITAAITAAVIFAGSYSVIIIISGIDLCHGQLGIQIEVPPGQMTDGYGYCYQMQLPDDHATPTVTEIVFNDLYYIQVTEEPTDTDTEFPFTTCIPKFSPFIMRALDSILPFSWLYNCTSNY